MSRSRAVLVREMSDERGAVGGLEGLAFGVLIFVFGTLIVVNAWAVVDGRIAASAAAREAVRAYVEAPSDPAGRDAAHAAAAAALSGHNELEIRVSISTADGSSQYRRCTPVEAVVNLDVPRISLPLINGTGGMMTVSGRHVEVIDPYRSGLAGGTCM